MWNYLNTLKSPAHHQHLSIMRSRSNSGVKLDNYARVVQQTILRHQVCARVCLCVRVFVHARARTHSNVFIKELKEIHIVQDIRSFTHVYMYTHTNTYCTLALTYSKWFNNFLLWPLILALFIIYWIEHFYSGLLILPLFIIYCN